jgi:hypothetical protein
VEQERDVFVGTLTEDWIADNAGWGLHIASGVVSYLGLARDHLRQVFIAKFVHGNQGLVWHGYPADHQRSAKDIPNESVLRRWLDCHLLSAPKISKLQKGKPCSL